MLKYSYIQVDESQEEVMDSPNRPVQELQVKDARTWYQLALLESEGKHINAILREYNQLQARLSEIHASVSLTRFVATLQRQSELIVLVLDGKRLVATAHASLTFPGCRPVVVVEQMIVAADCRTVYIRQQLVLGIEQMVQKRFSDVLPVRMVVRALGDTLFNKLYESFGYRSMSSDTHTKLLKKSVF